MSAEKVFVVGYLCLLIAMLMIGGLPLALTFVGLSLVTISIIRFINRNY
jgi:hypothetical protein